MELNPGVLPSSVQVRFPDPHKLHKFKVIVSPTEGIWAEGDIEFDVEIPETYNMKPPTVSLASKINAIYRLNETLRSMTHVMVGIVEVNEKQLALGMNDQLYHIISFSG